MFKNYALVELEADVYYNAERCLHLGNFTGVVLVKSITTGNYVLCYGNKEYCEWLRFNNEALFDKKECEYGKRSSLITFPREIIEPAEWKDQDEDEWEFPDDDASLSIKLLVPSVTSKEVEEGRIERDIRRRILGKLSRTLSDLNGPNLIEYNCLFLVDNEWLFRIETEYWKENDKIRCRQVANKECSNYFKILDRFKRRY